MFESFYKLAKTFNLDWKKCAEQYEILRNIQDDLETGKTFEIIMSKNLEY